MSASRNRRIEISNKSEANGCDVNFDAAVMSYTRTYVEAAAGRLTVSTDFELSKAKTDLASAFLRLLLRTELLTVFFLVLQRLNLLPWLSQYICLSLFPSRNGIKKKKNSQS